MGYHLAIKRNEILINAESCINHEKCFFHYVLNEKKKKSTKLKTTYYVIPLTQANPETGRLVAARDWGREGRVWWWQLMGKGFLLGMRNIPKLAIIAAQLCKYIETYLTLSTLLRGGYYNKSIIPQFKNTKILSKFIDCILSHQIVVSSNLKKCFNTKCKR